MTSPRRDSAMPIDQCHIRPEYLPLWRATGLDARSIFTDPRIRVWRSIPERENATLDLADEQGRPVRLHIKRLRAAGKGVSPAEEEARGIELLLASTIPTVPMVAWGALGDGRSFLVTIDLKGFEAADVLLPSGLPFERILKPTAELAAKLHRANLHHRDLYLNHFFVRNSDQNVEVRLIDAARVRRLPPWPLRRRWIIKDLAQFWYSTLAQPIGDEQRVKWLGIYAAETGEKSVDSLRMGIERKAKVIARHDVKLAQSQPKRNVAIPADW